MSRKEAHASFTLIDNVLWNKAERVAAKVDVLFNEGNVPDFIANQKTRELLGQQRQLTKRLRNIPN